ncbi:uncharacterized protein K441DRAFT_578728 [Cenococcum geophilum 1.58]|uniref:uncharacterized protein n=1 Tax=Cenococcum geophilum 1.58 TaxID=794803 RepID=UPI00358E56B8|nr:hypothetical protein K441DRAFT_578728 [Cenococcum geophilum 1.58]
MDLQKFINFCLHLYSISTQLYDKSTRFLLELLQNADDNAYNCLTPTLNFTYKLGSLRVDCNEVGFRAQNVEAICSIGVSTKAGLDHSTRYIGEKGIGFKSVFKVADAVWITSREYTFKFDRRAELGMIAPVEPPVWAEFPEATILGYTSFYLQLAEDYNEDELVQEILSFDSILLIFLRRIREINLKVSQGNGKIWSSQLSRADRLETGNLITELSQGQSTKQYFVRKHVVNPTVLEAKRPGCLQTEVLLAFPIPDLTSEPENTPQSAIDNFNSGPLRYNWPHYVPMGVVSSFFGPVQNNIIDQLRQKPVLECWKQTLVEPCSLAYVPRDFLDDRGTPFILNSTTAFRYLSGKYPNWEINAIYQLGVTQLTAKKFLDDLNSMIASEPSTFQAKSAEWHAQLATAMLPLVLKIDLKPLIHKMPIIPLREGQWVAAKGAAIFFSENTQSLNIPKGIPVLAVDPVAGNNVHRHDLFKQLGVRDCDATEICRLIVEMHGGESFNPKAIPEPYLVSHAKFLYQASWRPLRSAELWFVTKGGGRSLGSSVYIHAERGNGSPLARISTQLETRFPFVHTDYLKSFPNDKGWFVWLTTAFHISTIPRLATPLLDGQEEGTPSLSEEFRYLLANCQSSDILWVLRENWAHYSKWIENNNSSPQSPTQVVSNHLILEELKSQKVKCRNGLVPLSKTVLPMLDHFLQDRDCFPFLDVKDAKSPRWGFLSYFGVAVNRSAQYYVSCLEALHNSNPRKELLTHIYQQIQNYYIGEELTIRDAFGKRKLICASSGPPKYTKSLRWYTVQECIAEKVKPASEYLSCGHLFRCLLATGDGELASIIKKARLINKSTPLSEIIRVFRDLSNAFKQAHPKEVADTLKWLATKPIFPISTGKKQGLFDYLAPFGDDIDWLIADRDHLKDSFQGKAPLLAFTVEELSSMENLLEHLKADSRMLSRLVKSNTTPQGLISVHKSYTMFLWERREFIKALIPKAHPERDRVIQQIENIRASVADHIIQTHTLKFRKTDVAGFPGKAEVASSATNDSLNLFLTEDCITVECPSFELVEMIAKHCGIKNLTHQNLLQTILTAATHNRIQATLLRQGIHVNVCFKEEIRGMRSKEHQFSDVIPDDNSDGERADGIRLVMIDGIGSTSKCEPMKNRMMKQDSGRCLPFRTEFQPDGIYVKDLQTHGTFGTESALHIQYIGELMASEFFAKHLGALYDPSVHWTSLLSTRAGYLPSSVSKNHASFTFNEGDISPHIAALLAVQDYHEAGLGILGEPNYHFEVAVTTGGRSAPFPLSLSQIERIRKYRRKPGKDSPTDIIILMKISDLYSGFCIDFYVDPWKLYASDGLMLLGDCDFKARIDHTLTPGQHMAYCSVNTMVEPQRRNKLSSSSNAAYLSHRRHGRWPSTPSAAPGDSYYVQSAMTLQPLPENNNIVPLPGNTIIGVKEPGTFHKYSHRPLRDAEIRLLIVLPGNGEETLRIVIFHTSIERSDQYQALSYVWGTHLQPQMLSTQAGILDVTPSLHAALRHLRQKKEPVILWVDAICINQNDKKEKAQQIRLLPHIFQRATSVIVFLGQDDRSHHAIETLMQIRAKDTSVLWPKCISPIPASWSDQSIPPHDDRMWGDIIEFFQRPWFRRIWVIQEVVLAAGVRIICGKWNIDWNDLFSAVETIDREFRTSRNDIFRTKFAWEPFLELAKQREWEARQTRWSLIRLLESFRAAESTLRRDRLFALLGFASDGDNLAFEPSYDAPLEVIVRRYACAFIKQGKVMLLLYRAGLGSQPSRFPSWIPNWTIPRPSSLYDSSSRGMNRNASWVAEPETSCDPSSDELEIHGYQVDVLITISSMRNDLGQLRAYLEEVDSMIDSLKRYPAYASESLSDLKWKVPIAGALHPRISASGTMDLRSSYKALRLDLASDSTQGSKSKVNDEVLNGAGLNYAFALQDHLSGWRFVTTKRGYAGVAPGSASVGDAVAVFNGGGVPFLVRESESRNGVHGLVGECYIHGLMNGEAKGLKGIKEWVFRLH